MNASKPQKVNVYGLFTLAGKPLFNRGMGFSLDKDEHRMQSTTIESIESKTSQNRLKRAAAIIGEPVEWRFVRETEVMYVSF